MNRDQAVEELLALGLSVHGPAEVASEGRGEYVFTQHLDDQQDPAAMCGDMGDDQAF